MSSEAIPHKEWIDKAIKLYGKDTDNWKFKCPVCGKVQSNKDFKELGINGAEQGYLGFSCIGRFNGKGKTDLQTSKSSSTGCDYAGGGLFKLNPVKILKEDGTTAEFFDFAHKRRPKVD